MRTSQRAVIAIVLALGTLVVASMASASPPSPAPAAASQPTSAPGHKPARDPGAGEPQIVEPTPGMDNVGPTAFDTATIGADDTTLTIAFWSGVEPCYVLDHVDVSYGADAVHRDAVPGIGPNAGDVACIDIALQKQVTITLTSRSPGARS